MCKDTGLKNYRVTKVKAIFYKCYPCSNKVYQGIITQLLENEIFMFLKVFNNLNVHVINTCNAKNACTFYEK